MGRPIYQQRPSMSLLALPPRPKNQPTSRNLVLTLSISHLLRHRPSSGFECSAIRLNWPMRHVVWSPARHLRFRNEDIVRRVAHPTGLGSLACAFVLVLEFAGQVYPENSRAPVRGAEARRTKIHSDARASTAAFDQSTAAHHSSVAVPPRAAMVHVHELATKAWSTSAPDIEPHAK